MIYLIVGTRPNYIKAFDVAIIPYKTNKYTRSCYPLKLFEILALGKPVVVSGITPIEEVDGVARFTNIYVEFEQAISEYLRNDTQEDINRRINIARENTWEKKINRELELIGQFFFKRM